MYSALHHAAFNGKVDATILLSVGRSSHPCRFHALRCSADTACAFSCALFWLLTGVESHVSCASTRCASQKADGLLAVEDKDRCTALHRAVKHPECVRVLLQCSPSTVHDVINLQSKIGCTPLCLAAVSPHPALCEAADNGLGRLPIFPPTSYSGVHLWSSCRRLGRSSRCGCCSTPKQAYR